MLRSGVHGPCSRWPKRVAVPESADTAQLGLTLLTSQSLHNRRHVSTVGVVPSPDGSETMRAAGARELVAGRIIAQLKRSTLLFFFPSHPIPPTNLQGDELPIWPSCSPFC